MHSCQTHRQTIISHCKHFLDAWMSTLNLRHNALCERWKSAWGRQSARGRRGTAAGICGWHRGRWLLPKHRIFSHAACPTGAKMTPAPPILQRRGPYRRKEIIWELFPCIVSYCSPPESEEATLVSGRKIMLSGASPASSSHLEPSAPPSRTKVPSFALFRNISCFDSEETNTGCRENIKQLIQVGKKELLPCSVFFGWLRSRFPPCTLIKTSWAHLAGKNPRVSFYSSLWGCPSTWNPFHSWAV